jgi:mucin-19
MSSFICRTIVLGAFTLMLGVPAVEAAQGSVNGFPAAPTVVKAFSPTSIAAGAQSTVTLTLTNSVPVTQTNASFTDALTNMGISGAQASGGTCVGAGSNIFANSATALAFTGITVPASGSCTVTFVVTSSTVGSNPNSTSGVLTAQDGAAGAVSNVAALTVLPLPVTLQSFDVK